MIHIVKPYDLDKNLGKAYNESMKYYNDEDWIVLMDYDTLFLTPTTVKHIARYIELYPETGLFTCFTNRIANREQMLKRKCDERDSIKIHIDIAKSLEKNLYKATRLTKLISGFLMVIKKSTWNKFKFREDMMCLGVDHDYHEQLNEAGMKVLRMDGLYVFHIYRMAYGIKDKDHLLVT
jgi:GT2 family glycosyltransferase